MRTVVALLAGALLFGAGAAQAGPDRSPEAKLAKALDGRVAGKPVDCINLRDVRSSQIINDTAILYEGRGGTIYVNTPRQGASSLREDLVLVTRTSTSQLCSIDTVTLYDSGAWMDAGWVGLGKFVPYAKPAVAMNR